MPLSETVMAPYGGTGGLFCKHDLSLTPAWIRNYTHYKVWDKTTCAFRNFNSATLEVREWTSNFILHFTIQVITDLCWD